MKEFAVNTTKESVAARRQISRDARDAFPPMGVFAILNQATGQVLIGSSRNAPGSLNRIQFELRQGTHPDKDLQQAWQRAPSHFVFKVLDLIKERPDAAFDYSAELRDMERLFRAELCSGSQQ
jgi:hypothetical protein